VNEDTPAKFSDLFGIPRDAAQIETRQTITPRIVRMDGKRTMIDETRKETAKNLLERLPDEGEFFHIISNGNFDYWHMIPVILEMSGMQSATLHASTWTLNRPNAMEMLALLDSGRISSISLLTGIYFKRRESAVYATIANGLLQRGSRIKCLENHAKVALISDGEQHFIMEGSANFTANPRIEQNIVARSAALYGHHKKWIEEAFTLAD
jgi:hypothetical protein